MPRPCAALAVLLALAALPALAADEVTIYRCTDAHGRLTLRDTPCAKGEAQQTRSMLRPKDAKAAPLPAAPVPVASAEPAPPQPMVLRTPPRPLYECVTPDGQRYTSDTAEGNPRWVPLWTLGLPLAPLPYPGMRTDAGLSISHGDVRFSMHHGTRRPPFFGAAAWGAGTWVRDECHALPQQEVCARLVDRRDEIRRRFFNAQPSERDRLRVEERGINARLGDDCGGN